MYDVFDGHNDLPWHLRERHGSSIERLDDPTVSPFTTLPQLREGGVAAQFWSVFVHSDVSGPAAVTATLEQIDLVHRLIAANPEALGFAPTAAQVRTVAASGRTASLMGVEGGQQIDGSLAVLRDYARLGARYMTLTWSTTHEWADSATDAPRHGGLAPFGREVVEEMNRIGMIVDLSHVAPSVMHQALDLTTQPVVFSHSCAAELNPHPRNVPTDVLDRLPDNGGVLMITFVPSFVTDERRRWVEAGEHGTPPQVTVADVADHCDFVRERIGAQYVGLGSDLCGTDSMPEGLDSAAGYPALFEELARRGWSDAELRGLGFDNVLRVLEANDAAYTATVGADLLDRKEGSR
ncbi:dipeptidase [Brevibacterium sp. BRM-1]|uniref:dipeptidase n=1 Tax=Brevibacterium sp. BRM-1 TaxID=2999062 RepID=UPI002280B43E|nr:dipeptidase [Brevibacterium sp. BRM-1]WAL40225.1 dipeptidase [Brevibacterium sp. BRM-1]